VETAPREILENVEWSDWSPDGSNLLVVRTVSNENRIEYPADKVATRRRCRAGSLIRESPATAHVTADGPDIYVANYNGMSAAPSIAFVWRMETGN